MASNQTNRYTGELLVVSFAGTAFEADFKSFGVAESVATALSPLRFVSRTLKQIKNHVWQCCRARRLLHVNAWHSRPANQRSHRASRFQFGINRTININQSRHT